MNKLKLAALLAAVLAAPAFAHGDGHARHDGPVVKEQKPWGIAGDAKHARTIEITMSDAMRFTPDRIEVKQGESVRFVVRNTGGMLHEMVIGSADELKEHAALMKRFPNMEHDEPYMSHVPAGQQGEIVWNFNRPGTFQFACLVAGHFEAGMTGTIVVDPAAKKGKKA